MRFSTIGPLLSKRQRNWLENGGRGNVCLKKELEEICPEKQIDLVEKFALRKFVNLGPVSSMDLLLNKPTDVNLEKCKFEGELFV